MSKSENLKYTVHVDDNTAYTIKVRIGDGQPGDHNVFGDCPYTTPPVNDEPEWISFLGSGSEIRGTTLYISSATQENNPNTSFVSVRVFINDNQINQDSGQNILEAEEHEIVYFNQEINFI